MKTPPAAVPAGSAAAAVAAQQLAAPAANKVAEEEQEHPRSAFVRKVYGILSLQFVLAAAIAATACFVRPIQRFFACGPVSAVILASPPIVMLPMLEDREKKHTRNFALLVLFTLCCSLSVFTAMDIAFLQAAILIVLGLILCIIWAAKMGFDYDFNDIFAALLTCIPFPLKMVGIIICGFLATLLFSAAAVVDDANHDDGEDYNGGGRDDAADAPPAN